MSHPGQKSSIFFIVVLATVVVPVIGQAPTIEQPPNVVMIAIDTLRSDHLGCYGYRRSVSPQVDALATQGVLFERCYSAASWTVPSFMSMFTGLMPLVHGCHSRPQRLSASIPTLPEQFKALGYFCGAVISNPCMIDKWGFGRGFDEYDNYSVFLIAGVEDFVDNSQPGHTAINEIVTGSIVTRQAKTLMERAKKTGKPCFIFILYFDPHQNYVPPPPYNTVFDPDYKGHIDGRDVGLLSAPEDRDLQHLIALYDGEIAYTDTQIGELTTIIDAVFDPKHTLTILLSDHGEAFGEHGNFLHGHSAYREEVRVPMIWRWLGVLPEGHRVKGAVSTLDMAQSLKELLHFEQMNLQQGESLWPGLLGGQLPYDRLIFSQKANASYATHIHIALTRNNLRCHALFEPNLHKESRYEFYDIAKDPWEKTNIVESRPLHLDAMTKSIAAFWSDCENIRTLYGKGGATTPVQLTEEERRRLESLGYLGGR